MCQIIQKYMLKYRRNGSDKLNLWPFYHLTFKCILDLSPSQTSGLNGTTPPQGEHLCKIIFKSTHKCRSYSPDKLNLWPFYHLSLTFNLPKQMFQMALLLFKENTCSKLVWNPKINVGVMARTSLFMTILSFDLQVWPWPSTYLKSFKWHYSSSRTKTVLINFEIHASM